MTVGAKILAILAVLCLACWLGLMAFGVQPLVKARGYEIIYGEGEEFFSDARVYRKLGNDTGIIIQLPRARAAYRWTAVDFTGQAITFPRPARTIGSLRFWLKKDVLGKRIEDLEASGKWFWHYTDDGAAFSGDGFSCRVRKIRK